MGKLLREFCGMCETQSPQNGAIVVANGVPCKKDMHQYGEVEVGDADADTYLPEPTECESLAGAEHEAMKK
eukprot:183649-Karenia_brevis.AAC.1